MKLNKKSQRMKTGLNTVINMNNTNMAYKNKQERKNTGKDGIEDLKDRLRKEESELISEKEKLGYGDVSFDEFLKSKPEDLLKDQSDISKVIEIQIRAKELQEEKALLFAEEITIDELNKKHAVVHTDRYYILTEKEDPYRGGFNFTLESKQSFKDMYENQLVQLPNDKKISKAEVWLKSPRRRQYEGVIFNPNKENPKYFNIWKGFAVASKKGCCEKYKAHVREIICGGNHVHFDFVWKWCALLVQKPNIVAGTALVLLGKQGTGKNTFVDALGNILGGHYLPLDNIDQLLGKFNYHLKNAVLIHGNEALWGGNRKEVGKLKAIVTDEHKVIEGKGKDSITVPNFTHLILSSNEDWPVHIDRDDRRFFVLKVSDKHKEDKVYFKAIDDELKNGGLEALLFELLQEDISNFEHREFPQTDEAFGIKLMSADSCEKYIFESLKAGCFDLGNTTPSEPWNKEKIRSSIYEDYKLWCDKEGESKLAHQFLGRALTKLIPSIGKKRGRQNDTRIWIYEFPELNQARKEFEKSYKVCSSVWNS